MLEQAHQDDSKDTHSLQRRLVEVALFPNDEDKVLDLLFNQDGFVFRLLVSANNSELLRKKEGFYPWSS